MAKRHPQETTPAGVTRRGFLTRTATGAAALGLLPAALSHGVGSDSQRPFAQVIVGGMFSRLLISIYLMPVLYALVARRGDTLRV